MFILGDISSKCSFLIVTHRGVFLFTLPIQSIKDGHWWLYFGHDINNLSPVGYWPKSLVPNLEDHAGYVAWGGCAISNSSVISPPIGNGQWPRSNSAASFRNVQLVDMSGRGYDPLADNLHAFERETCYQTGVFRRNIQGNMFYYGGPGGNNCMIMIVFYIVSQGQTYEIIFFCSV